MQKYVFLQSFSTQIDMKENESALFSKYIIDGVQQDATPSEMLNECMGFTDDCCDDDCGFADIIDESSDYPITSFRYDSSRNQEYLEMVSSYDEERPARILYPETFTKMRIASALTERLWNKGHYRLGDLTLWAEWEWNSKPLGNMAAFYRSVKAASEYIYDLGCGLEGFAYDGCDNTSVVRFCAWLPESQETDQTSADETPEQTFLFKSSPYESRHPWIEDERKCSETMIPDTDSRIIYIPFDTSSFKLGGSLLAELNGHNGGACPKIEDPDYFIDCYEVVREMVEDGIIIAGTEVGDGGIAVAASRMCQDCGLEMNIGGIMSSYVEDDSTRVLFSEIPGVLIQVSNSNFDYLDSQLILQDVAYYLLGSPDPEISGVRLREKADITVAGILASLLDQATEGED